MGPFRLILGWKTIVCLTFGPNGIRRFLYPWYVYPKGITVFKIFIWRGIYGWKLSFMMAPTQSH